MIIIILEGYLHDYQQVSSSVISVHIIGKFCFSSC